MSDKQHTLKASVTVSGVGLHTGNTTNLTIKPAPENYGFKFQRIDLPGAPIIEADVDFVVDISAVANMVQPETDKLLGKL